MSSGGNNSGTWPGKERRKPDTLANVTRESLGFIAAEGVSAFVGIGAVAVADLVIPKPMLKGAAKCLAKVVVEPFLDPIEKGLTKICKLEECQVDPSKPRAERAEQLAKYSIIFGGAWAASMCAKMVARHGFNHLLKVPGHGVPVAKSATNWQKLQHHVRGLNPLNWSAEDKVIFAVDEGMHLGALYVMNNTLAPFTDNMIENTSTMLQKTLGFSEKRAHDTASMAWMWEAANVLGCGAGIGVIAGNHYQNFSKRLASLITGKPLEKH